MAENQILPAEQPILRTQRLILRPFTLADVPAVIALAGDRAVAENTLSIPHPYSEADAQDWISQRSVVYGTGKSINFAIAQSSGTLCGAVGLDINLNHNFAELGYWVGRPFWGQGYATEAAAALIAFAFNTLGLNRINATYFSDNPASGRVMEKLGMVKEGYRPQHTLKWGLYRDITLYGLRQEDWFSRQG